MYIATGCPALILELCSVRPASTERTQALKPNYQFEKRQRELEKKKKKAEKALKRETSSDVTRPEEGDSASGQAEDSPKTE
jgi:hypothetical protein